MLRHHIEFHDIPAGSGGRLAAYLEGVGLARPKIPLQSRATVIPGQPLFVFAQQMRAEANHSSFRSEVAGGRPPRESRSFNANAKKEFGRGTAHGGPISERDGRHEMAQDATVDGRLLLAANEHRPLALIGG